MRQSEPNAKPRACPSSLLYFQSYMRKFLEREKLSCDWASHKNTFKPEIKHFPLRELAFPRQLGIDLWASDLWIIHEQVCTSLEITVRSTTSRWASSSMNSAQGDMVKSKWIQSNRLSHSKRRRRVVANNLNFGEKNPMSSVRSTFSTVLTVYAMFIFV